MKRKQYKFLDLSGYMFSGKAAIIDLIREFSGYYVPYYRFEFPLIRIQDGIMDLEKALLDDWSPIRSDIAIKRFQKLITKMSGHKKKIFSFKEEELVTGWNYNEIFKGKFLEYSMDYMDSLIEMRIKAYWPFQSLNDAFHEIIRTRFYQAARIALQLLKGKRKSTETLAIETDLFFVDGTDFYEKTRNYLEKLLSITIEENGMHTIVMHNAFEPFNPWRPIRYFKDAKCIVVDRDPRDIYVTSLTYSDGFNDYPNIYSKISCAFNTDLFIKRMKMLMRNVRTNMDPTGRILRLRFEDIVMDYENALMSIYDFLGESEETHIKKNQFFSPSSSIKNIGLWKDYPNQKEIELIKKELGQYCRDF